VTKKNSTLILVTGFMQEIVWSVSKINKNVDYLSSSSYNFFNLTSVIGLRRSRNMPPAPYSIISKITQVSLFSAKYRHLIQLKYRDLHSGVNKHHILTSNKICVESDVYWTVHHCDN